MHHQMYAAAPTKYATMSYLSVTELFMNIGLIYSKTKEQKRVNIKKYKFVKAIFTFVTALAIALNEKIIGIARVSLYQE